MPQCFKKTKIREFRGLIVIGNNPSKIIGQILGIGFDSNMKPLERPAYYNRLLNKLELRPEELASGEKIWLAPTDGLVEWYRRTQLVNRCLRGLGGEYYFHGMVLWGRDLNTHNLNQALGIRVIISNGEVKPLSLFGELRDKFYQLEFNQTSCSGLVWLTSHSDLEEWHQTLASRRREEERKNVS